MPGYVLNGLIGAILMVTAVLANAKCGDETVVLYSGEKILEEWVINPNEIHAIKLPNEFNLGLKIQPADAGEYRSTFTSAKEHGADDLVKITLYNLADNQSSIIARTWGGANSRQGYSPRGGATRVTEVGEPGIILWLRRAGCDGQGRSL